MPNDKGKFNIAMDFDGVLHSYTDWKGVDVFDEPIPHAAIALRHLRAEGHTIILHTTRLITPALKKWLLIHGFEIDYFNENPMKVDNDLDLRKVMADVYIDDRGIQFNGDWASTIEQIRAFQPWFRKLRTEHCVPAPGDDYCNNCGLSKEYWGRVPRCPAE